MQITVVAILINACVYDPPLNRLDIYGYSCGDTIDDGITITEVANDLISYGVINKYERARVWLFNNNIERITIDSLSPKEFDSLKNKITEIYNLDPHYSKDSLYSGLKLKAEEYYWYDSISRDRISLIRNTQDNPVTISAFWFENIFVAKSYRERLLGIEEEYDFTEINDEE